MLLLVPQMQANWINWAMCRSLSLQLITIVHLWSTWRRVTSTTSKMCPALAVGSDKKTSSVLPLAKSISMLSSVVSTKPLSERDAN